MLSIPALHDRLAPLVALTPATLLHAAAEALAETRCTCRDLPADAWLCPACREAKYLDRVASRVNLEEALCLLAEGCRNTAAHDHLADLLPGITEAVLTAGPCTCPDLCTVCSTGRALDELARELDA